MSPWATNLDENGYLLMNTNKGWTDNLTNYVKFFHDSGLTQVRFHSSPMLVNDAHTAGSLGNEAKHARQLAGAGIDWLQYDCNFGVDPQINGPLCIDRIQLMSRELDDACREQHRKPVAMRIILAGDFRLDDSQTNAMMPTGPWMNEAVNSWCGLHDLHENQPTHAVWFDQVDNIVKAYRTRAYIKPFHFPDMEVLPTTFGRDYTENYLSYRVNTNAVRAIYSAAVMIPGDIKYAGYLGMGGMQSAFSNTVFNPIMRKIHKDPNVYPGSIDWKTPDGLGWQWSRVVPTVCDGAAVMLFNSSSNETETISCWFTNVPALGGNVNYCGVYETYSGSNFLATNGFTCDLPPMSSLTFLVTNYVGPTEPQTPGPLSPSPGVMWTASINARLFAVDEATNVYANAGGTVIKLNGAGEPLQTNTMCPLPGIAQRDSKGDFYFAGSFDGTQDFGGITLVGGWVDSISNPPAWHPGWPSCFLAKYSNDASLQWVTSFGAQAASNCVSDLVVNADGSLTVGFASPINARLAMYSTDGAEHWECTVSGGQEGWPRISSLVGTNGYFYANDQSVGSYDATGSLVWLAVPAPIKWDSILGANGKPVADGDNGVFRAGLSISSQESLLGRCGNRVWAQSLGAVEQWLLAGDSRSNLFLAGTNGLLSKCDRYGTLIWSTNLGEPVVAMVLDSQDNRFISFSDGSVARLESEYPPQPASIIGGPESQTVFVGDTVVFSVSVSGTPPFWYCWLRDGTNFLCGTNSSLCFDSASPAHSGVYSLVVTNVAGAVTSAPVQLRVKSVQLYVGSQMLTNGTYTFAAPPALTLRSAFTNGSSFYTLDGSAPSFAGCYYSGPFLLSHSATVRAIGYSWDFSQSEEADSINAIVLPQSILSASSLGGGTVSLSPPGGVYASTSTVTATAIPVAGWTFLYWLGDAAGTSNSVNVSMEKDKTIEAVFGTTLGTTVAGNGQIQLWPSNSLYPYGTVVRLTGVPQAGSYFGFWGNAATGNTNPLNFTVSNANPIVSSIFGTADSAQAALTILIHGRGQVSASPRANVYGTNETVCLTAVPDPGRSFLGWGGDATGTQNPHTVSMTHSKVITAGFSSESELCAASSGPGLASDGFRLTLFSCDPQMSYELLSSTDLNTWESLGVFTTDFNGEAHILDALATNQPAKFYKALQLP
jgi:hypothetical protein